MSGITDAVEHITTLKWNWAGHEARNLGMETIAKCISKHQENVAQAF